MIQPVDVIAVHSKEGMPTPMRIRYREDGEARAMDVTRVIERRDETYARQRKLTYKCSSVVDGIEHRYELAFDVPACTWFLNMP